MKLFSSFVGDPGMQFVVGFFVRQSVRDIVWRSVLDLDQQPVEDFVRQSVVSFSWQFEVTAWVDRVSAGAVLSYLTTSCWH